MICATALAHAQQTETDSSTAQKLKNRYDAAQNAQVAGNLELAAEEYKAFLSQALRSLGARRAQAQDFGTASQFFEQALSLKPDDNGLRLDAAEARRALGDMVAAIAAAGQVVQAEPQNARAHYELGRILLQNNENEKAVHELEAAVQREPNFEHGHTLAVGYLQLKNPTRAAAIFREMLSGFGDTPVIHMEFGRAYAEAGYPEHAIEEFKTAIAKDYKLPGAHYSLGAAYLVGLADAAFPQAAEEFRKELENHPDDAPSLYQLGYIAVSQHKVTEAEQYLTRAAELDPSNPDIPLSLGQAYMEADRPAEAETRLRKAIELTRDPSRNHYQVQRAHYLLARLLMQSDRQEEGKRELKMADQLLKQSVVANQGQPTSGGTADLAIASRSPSPPLDPGTIKQLEGYERQLSAALADSYNNLGAIKAESNQFTAAAEFFQQAAAWNPALEGLDYNWGKASFSANRYEEAIGPLSRYLLKHPNDTLIRSALGSALFNVMQYSEATATLKPLEDNLSSNSRLEYIYAVSLVRSGSLAQGIARLQALATGLPRLADIRTALGEAYAKQSDLVAASRELRVALELNPADENAKQQLAMCLIHMQGKGEARSLLTDLVHSGSQNPDVYLALAQVQGEQEDLKAAISTLETAAGILPQNESIHYQLALAYRRESRAADADREMKLYESIRDGNSQIKSTAAQH